MHPRVRRIEMPCAPQEESCPSFFTSQWKFDVFLSFAGKDTRLNFTDHLYDAFIRSGIRGFRDDKGIERGEDIKHQLLHAIKDSLCAVVVLSENYANSTWCLDELVEILESQKRFGRQVFPVFYGVDPSDVRYQRKSFEKALAKHEKRFEKNKDKVQKWRDALWQISNLSGWDSRSRYETEVIRDIVEVVSHTVYSNLPSYYNDKLVGIDLRMDQIKPLLEIEANDIRFVGVCGMSGVGKTTLARVIFEKISGQFEMCCFLDNVREISKREGPVSLQNDILSHLNREPDIDDNDAGWSTLRQLFFNKKVLLVLDDVDDVGQLKNLANPQWFGAGSRVIIITRDLHLLKSQRLMHIYNVKPMKKDESLELFSKKAFGEDRPEDGSYFSLSDLVVECVGGLPLALHVTGSFLCGRSILKWQDTLDRLKRIPSENILAVLQMSYDGLDEVKKTVFLDIACLFNRWKRDEVVQIFRNCNMLHPAIAINILIERGLLIEKQTLSGEAILEVHDLIQGLARRIVFLNSPSHVNRRSRLWNLEDVKEVLENGNGSRAIQAIVLPYYLDGEIQVHPEAFSDMFNLRLLHISSELKLPWGLERLPNALKVIRWSSYPLETLPNRTHLNKLVDIQMPFSKIKHWNDMEHMKNLRFMDLSNSKDMVETPDFSQILLLEKLNLEGCSSLVAVHHSLGELKRLVEVNLSSCTRLEILPKKLKMNSLTKLNVSLCKKLLVLPEFGECMKKFTMLDASQNGVTKLPESLGLLTGLKDLNLRGPRNGVLQMSGFSQMSLTMLDLSYCHLSDGSIPDDLGGLSSLITLHLEGNDFVHLPSGCFSNLFQLLHLYLDNCTRLESLPKLPPKLILLHATDCYSMEPLSSDGMWHLVSSLDHEHRHRTNYEKRVQPMQSGCVPEADFLAIMKNSEIPSWFQNIASLSLKEKRVALEYELVVDMPPYFRASKWCGLAVCLKMKNLSSREKLVISWSCKAPEDYYIYKDWENELSLGYGWEPRVCLMLLDFNEKTCWQHLRGNNNRLHIKLSITCQGSRFLKLECGWRALCKEEIQERCNTTFDFNKLARSEHNSWPEQLPLPGQGSSGGGGRKVSGSSNCDSPRRQQHNHSSCFFSFLILLLFTFVFIFMFVFVFIKLNKIYEIKICDS